MKSTKTKLDGDADPHSEGKQIPSGQSPGAQQATKNLADLAERLKVTVDAAAGHGESFDQTERVVRDTVLQMGFQAMELFVSLQGEGDLGADVQTDSGKPLQRSSKPSSSVIRSIFGEHAFLQFVYNAGKKKRSTCGP